VITNQLLVRFASVTGVVVTIQYLEIKQNVPA